MPPPEAIDPAALPPLPPGPPPRTIEPPAAGVPGKLSPEVRARLDALEVEATREEADSWAQGRRLAAALVPADATGALLIASVGGLLEDARALMGELKSAGVHSRFDVGYADGLRRALGTTKLGAEALKADGLVSEAPAALWWKSGVWMAVLPLAKGGLPPGLLERAMGIRAGWPGAPCTVSQAKAGRFDLTICTEGRRVALFLAVRGEHLLIGGARNLMTLRGASQAPRETLADLPERGSLPEVQAPLEFFARGLTALWTGSLRLGLRLQAGGLFARGRATSETLFLEEGPAPFGSLEALPASLLLRAHLRGAGAMASSLGVSAAFRALCPTCTSPKDRAAEAALGEHLGGEIALLLRGIDPAVLKPTNEGRRLPAEVLALKGFEQLWLARTHDEGGSAVAALDALVERMKRRGVTVERRERPGASEGERSYRLQRLQGPGAPLEVELGLRGRRLYLASRPELAGLLREEAGAGEAGEGKALTLRLDPVQLAKAIDPEKLPDPPTSLAEALLVYGLELARSSREPLPWRLELWPGEGGVLELKVSLPTPAPVARQR